MENEIMENMEKVAETTVETAFDGLQKAAENMDVAVTAQKALETVEQPKSWALKNTLIGAGIGLGGVALGYAADRWVFPWFNKKVEAAKSKRAAKKAEKAAKKAAKQQTSNQKAETPAPADPAVDPNFDPHNIDTTIDNV